MSCVLPDSGNLLNSGHDADQLRRLADAFPHHCWLAGADGNRRWYNSRWFDYTGVSPAAVDGWSWKSLLHPDDLAVFLDAWSHLPSAGGCLEIVVRLRGRGGAFRPFLTRVAPLEPNSAGAWLGTETGIAGLNRIANEAAETETARQAADLLGRVSRTLISQHDTQSLTQHLTDLATQLTGARFGAFFYNRLTPQGESYLLYTLSGVPRESFAGFSMPRNTPVFEPTFRGEGIVRSDDITRDPRYGKMPPHHGIPKGHLPVRSYLAAPVRSQSGEVLGGLFFGHPEPGVFQEKHEHMILGITAQAAVALDNARLIAQLREAQQAAELSNTQLSRANADLKQFAYSAGHDLQEPVRNIAIYGELLEHHYRSALDAPGREFLNIVVAGARRIERLITDLLRYAEAADAGDAGTEPTDANGALSTAIWNLQAAIAAAGADVTSDRLPEVAMRSIHLEQVLQNLIGNAIKYHGERRPRIHVSAKRDGADWIFTVADNGIGIDPKHSELIFGVFKRLHAADRYPGTGIGLALCRRVLERYGGRIWLESSSDAGSRFSFSIPAREEEALAGREHSAPS